MKISTSLYRRPLAVRSGYRVVIEGTSLMVSLDFSESVLGFRRGSVVFHLRPTTTKLLIAFNKHVRHFVFIFLTNWATIRVRACVQTTACCFLLIVYLFIRLYTSRKLRKLISEKRKSRRSLRDPRSRSATCIISSRLKRHSSTRHILLSLLSSSKTRDQKTLPRPR